jgi:hypothetical protein
MQKKRTFGDLRKGSYFWSAGIGSVTRQRVFWIDRTDDKVKFGTSWYTMKSITVANDATEYIDDSKRWFTDKQDARRCAYELIQKEVKDAEIHLNWLKERAESFRRNFIDC